MEGKKESPRNRIEILPTSNELKLSLYGLALRFWQRKLCGRPGPTK